MKTLFAFLLLCLASLSAFATLPEVNFTYASRDISEGQEITITATLNTVSPDGVIVPFTVGGTSNGDDHDLVASSIYFAPNNLKAYFTFRVFGDNTEEGTESVIISMQAPMNATLGATKTHTVLIHDADDTLPQVNFSATASTKRENNVVNIEVNMSAPSTEIVLVPFTVSGTATSADHNLQSGTAIFFPGSTKTYLSVTLNDDGIMEDDETVIINLKHPAINASLGSQTVYVLTIEATYPGVKLVGVNKTVNEVILDGSNHVVKLELLSGSNPVGGFNGGGTGNKAFFGLNKYNAVPLSQFQSLQFKTKVPSISALNKNIYLNFQVDLNCNPSSPDYAIIVADYMFASPGPQNQWNTYTINFADQVFRSVGGKGGLPSHISMTTGVLQTVINNFPNACFANASTGDGGMKKLTVMPAILLVLGDSATTAASQVWIDDITAVFTTGTDVYNFENL